MTSVILGLKNEWKAHPLLTIKDFSLSFRTFGKGLRLNVSPLIQHLNLHIYSGEVVAIVGASGTGKSLLANAIVGLTPKNAMVEGELLFKGNILTAEKQKVLRGKEIFLIPQSVTALDPLMKVKNQIHSVHSFFTKDEKKEILQKVGLSISVGEKYPFELSGGMIRKVFAAILLANATDLIIADEPTPGLDSASLQIFLTQLKRLANEGKGVMFITHDIQTALEIADRIVVMKDGRFIENAHVRAFSGKGEQLRHPFTKALWNALPQNEFIQEFEKGKVEKKEDIQDENGTLKVSGISYWYKKENYIFKDLSLTIKPGEIVGISGYSGSGKTTMAKVIAGLLKPVSGEVKVGDNKPVKRGVHPVQMIWQHPEKAINPRWQMQRVLEESKIKNEALLDNLGIKKEWLTRRPGELSGGELQRFCIARVLTEQTKYIIADEMTTMLDAIAQAELWRVLIQYAKERNIGVLAISHNRELLERISDRVIRFDEIRMGNLKE
ncbi:ATP-binding cassette domain-containing protein [Caldibacillus thermoamylovorans]